MKQLCYSTLSQNGQDINRDVSPGPPGVRLCRRLHLQRHSGGHLRIRTFIHRRGPHPVDAAAVHRPHNDSLDVGPEDGPGQLGHTLPDRSGGSAGIDPAPPRFHVLEVRRLRVPACIIRLTIKYVKL